MAERRPKVQKHDFWTVSVEEDGRDPSKVTISPMFIVNLRSKDLLIRGGDFYAVWDEASGMWSRDEQTVIDIIDNELKEYKAYYERSGKKVRAKYMKIAKSGSIDQWHKFVMKQMRDNTRGISLDEKIVFSNTEVKKSDYVSRRLPYALEEGDCSAYDEMMSVLYDPPERAKIEWAIGAIISGDAKRIQKFEVLYGSHGTGKGTVLSIIEKLFDGYWNVFSAKQLGSASSAYALESFKSDPLVSIQYDGDLSHIEDNTKINSIVSHETMEVNAKYTKIYCSAFKSFLFMGTNKPVKITDAKSGIIRRLIDVYPSGRTIPYNKYHELKNQVKFELGAIAYHCLEVYKSMGESYYENYVPTEMIVETNHFYDFIDYYYDDFTSKNMITQNEAWSLYQAYCDFAHAYKAPLLTMKNELRNYFESFYERKMIDGKTYRNLYFGFLGNKFKSNSKLNTDVKTDGDSWLRFECQKSLFDEIFSDAPAQYAKEDGSPVDKWSKCTTKLIDIDTKKLHWMQPQAVKTIVVADFDFRNEQGEKDLTLNKKEAAKWKKTYAELSKSGGGIHLVYYFNGDVGKLSHVYGDHIEIKTFSGDSSLRRMLTYCNDIPIATLTEGALPVKEDKLLNVNWDGIKSEQMLVAMIVKNLHKQYHPDTSSSINYINDLLNQAYDSGISYDVSWLSQQVREFAQNSSNQSDRCFNVWLHMKFKSKDREEAEEKHDRDLMDLMITRDESISSDNEPITFFDCECYPNFFGICYKEEGAETVVKLVNPTPDEVINFINNNKRTVGFNNRQYDNHLLWARAYRKYTNEQLYALSQQMIETHRGYISDAYDLSYTDVYDFSTEKMGLKKWEIRLGIHHQEMGIPWNEPIKDDMIETVMEYCANDVIATEAVFHERYGDFLARKIQVDIVHFLHPGIKVSVNDTTNTLSKRIIFGNNKSPQSAFNYRDLSKPVGSEKYEEYLEKFGENYRFRVFNADGIPEYRDYVPGEVLPDGWSILPFFPGYLFGWSDRSAYYNEEVTKEVGLGKSIYLGQAVGEGGRVFSRRGYWTWVLDLDILSQHPHTIMFEVLFGVDATKIFEEIVRARAAIKHKDFEFAGSLLGGCLKPYLTEEMAGPLAQALKIVINSIYGLTKAGFVNEFRDVRNEDNIVAKRGALFMTLLKREIEKQGYIVCHIKTDSIKIPNADEYIKNFAEKFAKEYGYSFEVEGVFTKFLLFNDAVYIAKEDNGNWIAKGEQFKREKNPYVYKKLLTHEDIVFDDMCETKSVQKGAIYLDLNEGYPDVSEDEKLLKKVTAKLKKQGIPIVEGDENYSEIESIRKRIDAGHNYTFIGRVGRFTPVLPGAGGGSLLCIDSDGNASAISGSSGYLWLESEYILKYGLEKYINRAYYDTLVDEAISDINELLSEHGVPVDYFLSDDVPEKILGPAFMNIPETAEEEIPWDL